ncbi:MAG: hypothetical protein H7Z41_06760 [Cytophagales bacterium]|nr:hypothetical protein [Armatimonadota bacterium]
MNHPVSHRRSPRRRDTLPVAVPAPSLRLRPAVAVVGSLAVGGTLLAPVVSAAGVATIQITAERTLLRADGRSTTALRAQVRDENGVLVPDGTRVRFSATAGRLENTVVETQAGIASVFLTAADLAGTAVVTVNLESGLQAAPANITIRFSVDAETSETGTNWVRVDGAYVGYISDYQTIQANGRRGKSPAKITYRSFTVTADSLQLDVKSNLLRAQGNVTVREGGGEALTFNALRYDLLQGTGVAERLDEGRSLAVELSLLGGEMVVTPPLENAPPLVRDTWQLKDLSDGNVAIVARSLSLNPGSQIRFARATFYLNGEKTLSVPNHVMELQQGQLFREQIIGLGPTGVSVDLPLYYDVRPQGIGTLHVRRGAQVGSSAYSVRPGWRADLDQSYSGRNGAEGTVEVNNLAQGDWGLRLRHAQRLGSDTRGSLFVDFPNNRDLFLTSQASRSFKSFTLNAVGYASRSPGYDNLFTGERVGAGGILRGQLYVQTNPRPFLRERRLSYTLSAGTSRQNFYGFSSDRQGVLVNNNANLRLNTAPIALAPSVSLTQSLSVGQAFISGSAVDRRVYTGQGSGMTLLGSTAVNRTFGRLGAGSLTYDYAQTPLGLGFSNGLGTAIGKHRAGVNLSLGDEAKLSLSVNASQGLDVPNTTVFSNVLFGLGGPWRGRFTFTATRYGGFGYRDSEFALVRRIAGRDVALYYSTTARRVRLDFAGVRF